MQYQTSLYLTTRISLHERFSTNAHGWYRWVFDRLELPATARVLELGCGNGALWSENADRIPPGWEVVVSDISAGMLEQVQQRLTGIDHLVSTETINAELIPYGAETFDAVIANHMLYHVENRGVALDEIRRVLKPGGRLYASTVGARHLRQLHELIAHFAPSATRTLAAFTRGFTLENGGELLAEKFSEVWMDCYDDSLHVTDAAPLAQYILSLVPIEAFGEDGLSVLWRYLDNRVQELGAIDIDKESGIFVAAR